MGYKARGVYSFSKFFFSIRGGLAGLFCHLRIFYVSAGIGAGTSAGYTCALSSCWEGQEVEQLVVIVAVVARAVDTREERRRRRRKSKRTNQMPLLSLHQYLIKMRETTTIFGIGMPDATQTNQAQRKSERTVRLGSVDARGATFCDVSRLDGRDSAQLSS
ncbi:hypothetical protein BKA81DRAFT_150548 [Phyllosticta paracitricarpa]